MRVLQGRNNRIRHAMSRRTRPKRNLRADSKSVFALTLLAPGHAMNVKSCIMRLFVGETATPRGKRRKPGINADELRRHLATCRETIAPAFLAHAACSQTTTAQATSLTATVVPCARAVCYSAPTCTRLAAQHNNKLSLLGTSY